MSAGKQRIPSFEEQIRQAQKQPTPAERLNRVFAPKITAEVAEGLKAMAAKWREQEAAAVKWAWEREAELSSGCSSHV